ncbi:MAG: response regulator transcription factor [Nitrospira sp.]|nr:response regulator transcription factor [Nitrospira sp.]
MIKILIADDHPIVRSGLKQIISEEDGMSVAGEAQNASEVLAFVRKNYYDVVILDISLPDRSGLNILEQLRYEKPKLPVLILSMYPEEQYAVRVLKAGASGYMTKESAPEELVKAIRKVASGGKYVSPTLAERLALDLEVNIEKPLHETLSNREFEVMLMVASGKKAQEIADNLCLSVKTVSTYRSRILKKMSLKNNTELVQYVIKNNLSESKR